LFDAPNEQAPRALALLAPSERAGVLKYLHVRDAKMALGSHLLKRLVITKTCAGVRWRDATATRDAKTKPVFVDPATGRQPVAFNVSHQAGLVALAACTTGAAEEDEDEEAAAVVDIGVDVVSPAERRDRDHKMIADDGWAKFVDMHADVFAPGEAAYLKYQVLGGLPPGTLRPGASYADIQDVKLRAFYTLWCLREAYLKMTGDALLAEWLDVLEFRGFQAPRPEPTEASLDRGRAPEEERDQAGAETVAREHDIWFRGTKVDDANVCMRSLGRDFMVCTAVRTPAKKELGLGFKLGSFDLLSIDEILDFAESRI